MLYAKVIRRPAIPVLAELSLHRLWCPVVKLDARLAAYNTSCPDGIIMDYFDALRADVVILGRCQYVKVLEECPGWRNALTGQAPPEELTDAACRDVAPDTRCAAASVA